MALRRLLQVSGLFLAGSATALVAAASLDVEVAPVQRDPVALYRALVERYRGLSEYSDSLTLARRTVDSVAESNGAQVLDERIDCVIEGSRLELRSSSFADSADCDTRDHSFFARARLARHLWTLPHLAFFFSEDPLRSFDGVGGELVPTKVDEVSVAGKPYLKLHLARAPVIEGEAASTVEPADADDPVVEASANLYVNPQSMLVERIEHRRTVADGVRYEATIDISPSRAVPALSAEEPEETRDPEPVLPRSEELGARGAE